MKGILFINKRDIYSSKENKTFIVYNQIDKIEIKPEFKFEGSKDFLFSNYEYVLTGKWQLVIYMSSGIYSYICDTREQAEKTFSDIKNEKEDLIIHIGEADEA